MDKWRSYLKANPVEWLLEEDNPSVRYFALTDILEKPQNSPDVKDAKKAIMAQGTVPKILGKMNSGGFWETPSSFYTAKYKGTIWQLLSLAELRADSADARVKAAFEFILQNSQHNESHGFSMAHAEKTGGGRPSGVIPCLTGNMVFSLIRLGYLDDPRVQAGIEWINRYQRFDDADGEGAPKGWPYDRLTPCFGKHSCHMGAAKALKALAEIPTQKRNKNTQTTIQTGAEYFLKHHIYKQSHNPAKVAKPGWLKLGFPLMYQTDVLELFGILSALGYKDNGIQEAADLIVSKQSSDGRWKLENTFNGKTQTNIERRGEESKWVTLNALKALKQFYN